MPELAAEAVLISAGGRAILLQLADPAIGHGVADHSDFEARPLDRLHATLTFAYAVVFGTPDDVAAVTRRVNRAHGPVRDDGSDERPAYSAFDPHLQLWVTATLYDSAVTAYETVFGPLQNVAADQLYAEYGRLGDVLQMSAALWPPDRAAFARYWERRLGELETDPTTRAVARQLLYPTSGPLLLRAAMPLGRLLTVGYLPPEAREVYELPWTTAHQRRFERILRLTALIYPRLPRRVRHWPKNHYLRRLRRSMATRRTGTAVAGPSA